MKAKPPKTILKISTILAKFAIQTLLIFTSVRSFAGEVGTIELVDGRKLDAEFLFVHPVNKNWIIRKPDNSSVQSLPEKIIHKFKEKTVNSKRKLSKNEELELQRNCLWGTEHDPAKQIGNYAKEKWEKKPLIVWAKPGESSDAMQANAWLDENGKPLSQSPWTTENIKKGNKIEKSGYFDGDILLPAADKEYEALQPGNRDHLEPYRIRHLTIERNAHYMIRYTVEGNLWMKDGSKIGKNTQTGGFSNKDNKHTVARFCNFFPDEKLSWANAPDISHWVYIDTGEKGSLEIIGLSGGASDRLSFLKGTLIVSEDSYIGNGNRGCFYTMKDTTTILLDGAKVGCPDAIISSGGATYGVDGTLLFGTPEHPLKKDFYFGAAFFDMEKLNPNASPNQRTKGASFVLGPNGHMKIHSSNPKQARVIFCPRGKNMPVGQYILPRDYWKYTSRQKIREYTINCPPKPELWEQPGIPTGICAVFRGKTDFDGVMFDGFEKGGIIVDPNERKKWKNVFFGKENKGQPDELFKSFE